MHLRARRLEVFRTMSTTVLFGTMAGLDRSSVTRRRPKREGSNDRHGSDQGETG